ASFETTASPSPQDDNKVEPPARSFDPTPPAPAQDNNEKPAAKQQKRAAANQTIRVDIDRLDLLLNLVGELVINRTRISDIANTIERALSDKGTHLNGATQQLAPLAKELGDSSALLARTTNEIQESIMKVRMVPIGQVFD